MTVDKRYEKLLTAIAKAAERERIAVDSSLAVVATVKEYYLAIKQGEPYAWCAELFIVYVMQELQEEGAVDLSLKDWAKRASTDYNAAWCYLSNRRRMKRFMDSL